MMLSSLIEHLKKVKDLRKFRGRRHPIWVVLLVVILGMMAGYEGYRELGYFVKAERNNLINCFQIMPERLPSYSTIRRVMIAIDWQNLSEIFNEWALKNYPQMNERDWLAMDGKSLRSTVTDSGDKKQNFAQIVSVFSQESRLVVKVKKFENKKGSEITQVQDIVREGSFKGKVFTLDAVHCNQQTMTEIIQSGNDYLVALKKNQPTLYNQVKDLTTNGDSESSWLTKENSHGRQTTWEVSVFKNSLITSPTWSHIQSIIKVERWGWRGIIPYIETAYYLSSISIDAAIFSQRIREHWGIENQVHWVKDVILNEDNMRIKEINTATNFSVLKTIVLNLFRHLGFLSITEGKRWLGNHWKKLLISSEV